MKYRVFFSYSWKDMPIAMRLYADLIRSGVSIWRDQMDGDPTVDFREEFLSRIDECEYFLMLDSKNYRNKSNWCCTEIERCLENQKRQRGKPRIIVCLLDVDGDWRWNYKDKKAETIFGKINMFKYQEMFFDKYDNDLKYYQSVNFICSLFHLEFKPWNQLPNTQDLMDELSNHTQNETPLSNEDYEMLLNEYKAILNLSNNNRKTIQRHYALWVDDCKECGINIFFPLWTYCVWLGQDMHNGKYDKECKEQFVQLANCFPEDPRSWRGLGCIYARLGVFSNALESLLKAKSLMNLPQNKRHKDICEFEVLYNIGQIYINLEQYENALKVLLDVNWIMKQKGQNDPTVISNINLCLVKLNRPVQDRIDILEDYLNDCPAEPEILVLLGLCYSDISKSKEALTCFMKAYSLQNSIRIFFYILCSKIALGQTISDNIIKEVLARTNISLDDNYWKGAICYYVLNDTNAAEAYYKKCDSFLYEWYDNR